MRPLRSLGLCLARIGYVRRAIAERADLGAFRGRPRPRLVLGVGLIGLSMLLGWPLITGLAAAAVWLKAPLVAAIGGPLAYGLSWAVYGLGLLIAGRAALTYANAFHCWLARVLVERLIGHPPLEADLPPAEPPRAPPA